METITNVTIIYIKELVTSIVGLVHIITQDIIFYNEQRQPVIGQVKT